MVKRAVATIESCLDSYDDSIRFRAAELIIKVDTGAIGKPEVRNVTNFIQNNLNVLDDTIRRGLGSKEAANGNIPRPAHDDVHNRRDFRGRLRAYRGKVRELEAFASHSLKASSSQPNRVNLRAANGAGGIK